MTTNDQPNKRMKHDNEVQTKVITIPDINHFDQAVLKDAVRCLQENKAISFPTETVYGLGANALNEKAGISPTTKNNR